MGRDSPLLLVLGLMAVVIGGFAIFWIFLKIWVAFGFLAVAAILLAFAWWYDRRDKRARAGLPRV
jgi:membrane protein implicated in regulation of membrane protease activity